MLSSRRIQFAFVAALLLAQLELPVAHGLAFLPGDRGPAAVSPAETDPVLAPVPGAPEHRGALHDPTLCPVCLALCQVRSAVARVPAVAPLPAVPRRPGLDRADCPLLASPVELASAPPRAPPLPSLSLA